MSRPALIGIALTLLGAAAPAGAHPVPFSYVDVRVGPAALDVTIVAHIYDVAHDLGIEPVERLLEPSVLASRAEPSPRCCETASSSGATAARSAPERGPLLRRCPNASPSGCVRGSRPVVRSV